MSNDSQSTAHHAAHDRDKHAMHQAVMTHTDHDGHENHRDGSNHGGHVDHTGHEQMFRRRFWINLILTLPVLVFSPFIQQILGFSIPPFPGSRWIGPVFSFIVFFYGGLPFIKMAIPEVQHRLPGMMTLISLAIVVSFAYSVFAVFTDPASGFFWEMATLIDIMLLGHWIEMRSVRQASGALQELANLMPDTAERILDNGETEEVPVSCSEGRGPRPRASGRKRSG